MHSSALMYATRPAYPIVFNRLNVIKFLFGENFNVFFCVIFLQTLKFLPMYTRQLNCCLSNIVRYSFQTVSENLEQIATYSPGYCTFRIVMSLNANRFKCEQSEKLKC